MKHFDLRLCIRLIVWSLVVGAVLYWLKISPGEIYGTLGHVVSDVWNWTVNSGLEYILLGATIVVPIYFILHFKNRNRR